MATAFPGARRGGGSGVIVALVVWGLAGCAGDSTGPQDAAFDVVVTGGAAQRGLEHEVLRVPVTVRVLDDSGRPVSGTWVHFSVVSGGGAVTDDASVTNEDGVVWTRWRLGPQGPQGLRAALDSGAEAVVAATALPLAAADIVVVHGAAGPLRGALLVQDSPEGMEILEERVGADTVLTFAPLDVPGPRVLLFPSVNRPLQQGVAWTPAPDTVHVYLEPPVPVDVSVRVAVGDFDLVRADMEHALAETAALWRALGMGVTLGAVTYRDETAADAVVDMTTSGLCAALSPGSVVQVTVVTQLDGGGIGGYGCDAGYVFLGRPWVTFTNLLAHEIGHTFTLQHLPGGLMNPGAPGAGVRDGEIYRAHFNATSALNTIFGAQPEGERRACGYLGYPSPCLPMDYTLGSAFGAPPVR